MVRRSFLEGHYRRCVVYTGPGRKSLYSFAEVRPFDRPPGEADCNHFHGHRSRRLLRDLESRITRQCDMEFNLRTFRLKSSDLAMNELYLDRGAPDLIRPAADVKVEIDLPGKIVTACVRDRPLATERNWELTNWAELVADLSKYVSVVVVGRVRQEDWCPSGERILDLTNKTSLDQVVSILHQSDLAMGGSTGTLHLASRCGIDHFVWGSSANQARYEETNWYGAQCCVLTEGWRPELSHIMEVVMLWRETGRLQCTLR